MGGAGEGRIDLGGVAIVIVERDVVRDVIVELRRAGLGRVGGIGHGRQRLDVELDGFGGIARLRHRLGHDEGHGIADIAHLVGRQRHAVGLQQRRAVAALQRQTADEGPVVGRARSAPVQTPSTPGIALAAVVSMPLDDAVGVAGADDPGIGLPRQAEIVGVLALAADQRVVFLAADRLADAVFLQCNSVFERAWATCDLALK